MRLRGTAPYGDVWFARKAATFRYGDLKQVGQRVLVPYGDVHYCRLRAAMPYGDVPRRQQHILHRYGDSEVLRTRWTAGWGELFRQRTTFQVPYWLTRAVAVRHGLHYAVSELNPVTRRCSIPWALLGDLSLQAVANTPELAWQGEVIQIHAATLSCDEDSPVWLARIEIAERADFARIGIGDPLTLTLGLETFRLAVDGKTLSRESVGVESHEITAVSPAALLDAPFAEQISFDRTSAVSAREAVEGLVDSIVWQLPDWIIPAGRLMLDGVTPLSGARSIVAAIGGIMESAPDGTLICRLRHPVSIPQYEGASVSHSLFDSDVLGSVARIAPARGFNRVTLANEEGAGSSDADHVDYVAVPDDATRGTVRARLGFARAVKLAHTGNPGTVVRALGQIVRTETETIEFVEGQASARYPVTSLQGWSGSTLTWGMWWPTVRHWWQRSAATACSTSPTPPCPSTGRSH
ncbi:MAG: hypothetical protein D4S02_11395 [Rhodocyclaceae bacterium]|nr:MAG: hypothetical protein D4S02_11395 [Rhodocyclaceae bacterium]